jgi:hypothetical protein
MSFTAYLGDFVSSRGIHALGMEIANFNNISVMVVSFIGGGNQRKSPT